MIAPWVVYCLGLAGLFALAALGLEYVARAGHWPVRWIWVLAILATVLVPVAINAFATQKPLRRSVLSAVARRDPALPLAVGASGVSLDGPLLALWLLASMSIAIRIAATARALNRRRADWDDMEVDGRRVLVSRDVGPAVIGLAHRRTVLPRWALDFDAGSRALMFRHESEHSRAGDPLLLAGAAVALIAMPWNPVLWFLVRRLRLAIEMDCDARVLASGANPRAYASLLLTVGERMSHTPFAWAIALATPHSLLEQRIVAITAPFRPRHPRLTMTAIGAGVTLALALACGTGHPDPVTVSSSARSGRSPHVATEFNSNAYAEGGDTLVIQMSQRGPGGPRGFEFTRGRGEAMQYGYGRRQNMEGPGHSMQYLYGRAPMVLRYPDGYEVAVTKGTTFQALLDDHSHDAPVAHLIRPSSLSPILEDKRICTSGRMILVGAETCPRSGSY